MKVSPPGSVNVAFGSPIRDERPAARRTAGMLDVRTTLLYLLRYACPELLRPGTWPAVNRAAA
jgi:hypothetical protein